MSGTAPAGWYADGLGAVRWWDGAAWTSHVAPPPAPAVPAPVPVPVQHDGASASTAAAAARSEWDAASLLSWSQPARSAQPGAATTEAVEPQSASPAVRTSFTPALTAPSTPGWARWDVVQGWALVICGLALLAFGVHWFLYATSHGYFSTGGMVTGGILTFRGATRLRETRRSGLPLVPFAWLSPRLIGVLAVIGLLLVAGVVVANKRATDAQSLQVVGLSASTGGAWPTGYTDAAPDGAYRPAETNQIPCPEGFRCAEIEVLTRTACRNPQVSLDFYAEDGRPREGETILGLVDTRPGVPSRTMVSTSDVDARSFSVTSITCGR